MSLKETIDKFERLTNYPLNNYLIWFLNFYEENHFEILNYYKGNAEIVPTDAFNNLEGLIKESKYLDSLINYNKHKLDSLEYWELLEKIEIIKTKLETINNSSKWLRSSITKGNFSPNPETDYILSQNQTLEKVSKNITGSSNENYDWYDIAIKNDLKEESYTYKGGNQIKIVYKNRDSIKINSVVDNLTGEKIYGLDLQKRLEFKENDLKVLNYKETIDQAVDILANLRKRDIPEFEEDGLQSNLVVGSNKASIFFPALIRQFVSNFSKDDTIRAILIQDLKIEQDNLFLTFQIETKLKETIEKTIII